VALNDSFWNNEKNRMLAILQPRLEQMAVEAAKQAAQKAGIAFNPNLANANAARWARDYTDALLKQLGTTSTTGIGEIIAQWVEKPGATYSQLQQSLIQYGNVRAQAIAVTETTRAYAEGEIMAYKQEGITEIKWHTNRDELVCFTCGPLHGKVVKIGEEFGKDKKGNPIKNPPAHVNCRCSVVPSVSPNKERDAVVKPANPAGAPMPASTVATPVPVPVALVIPPIPVIQALDHDKLKQIDLHATEPTWNVPSNGKSLRYGGVIFDDTGRVLLRKPTGNFDGYAWTFPKGGGKYNEHPVDVAMREVEQESGHKGKIVGLVPGGYESGSSRNYFFVMRSDGHDKTKMDKETEDTIWATPEEAIKLIEQTTNAVGKDRDLNILDAAVKANTSLLEGKTDNTILFTNAKPFVANVPTPPSPPAPKPAAKKPAVIPVTPPAPKVPTVFVRAEIKVKPVPKAFPVSVDVLKPVKSLGGSTGAQLMQDAKGKKFVVKRGASADHLAEEAATDELYKAMGIKVPEHTVYQTPSGPVKVSAYLPDTKTLKDVLATGDKKTVASVKKQLKAGFVADAFVGNWDVIGQVYDNILVDSKGKVWRVDNGGGLRFRAQGDLKSKAATEFNEYPAELWSMRGKTNVTNDQTKDVFGDIPYDEVLDQLREIEKKRTAILAAAPPQLKTILSKRLDEMKHVVDTSETMQASNWSKDYRDSFGYGDTVVRQAGIVDKLPDKMTTKQVVKKITDIRAKNFDVTLLDSNGKPFDDLRGTNSSYADLHKAITAAGGRTDLLENWMGQQGGDSWNDLPRAYKYYIAKEKGNTGDYFWLESSKGKGDGLALSRKAYDKAIKTYGEEAFRSTFNAYHAFNYELLMKTDLPNIDRSRGVITLWRTETTEGLCGANLGDTNFVGKRGAAESTSLVNPTYVKGDHLTRQEIPLTDIIGTYLTERTPGSGMHVFLGDRENEILAILGKSMFDYLAKGRP